MTAAAAAATPAPKPNRRKERGGAARHSGVPGGSGRGGGAPRRRHHLRPAPRPLLHVGPNRAHRLPGLPRAHGCGGGSGRAAVVGGRQAQAGWEDVPYAAWECRRCPAHLLLRCPPPPVATGYTDRQLVVECSQRGLLVQAEGSPPLIDRLFEHAVDASQPVETFRCRACAEETARCGCWCPSASPAPPPAAGSAPISALNFPAATTAATAACRALQD